MVLSYIFEGEHYPYRIEENAEDLQEFIEHVENKRDVIIDGKASDIWKLLVDLDILDNILKCSREKIEEIEKLGYSKFPICIAKTQYSLSDDPKNLECKEPFSIHVQDVILKAGAEFIVVLTGKIVTMPGLSRIPAAEHIDIDENENIVGIF